VAFRRSNHTLGLGQDDPVVFNIVLCRVLLHPFKGLVPYFNGCFAVFVAPDGIMFFFGIWFAFWNAIICYVDDNICKLLNRILCTADSVSAEFQSCLMWECRPVSLMELPSRYSKKWRRCICNDDYWIAVTSVYILISLPTKIQIEDRVYYAEIDSWKRCSSRVKVGGWATIEER